MTFSEGDFVQLKRDPSVTGIVLPGERRMAGAPMVRIRGSGGQETWYPLAALQLVPKAPATAADLIRDGIFAAPGNIRRVLTRERVTGRLSDMIYSMESTNADFYAYQFKPVLKLLNSPTDAILIADEVGLGKTIEAGLIWTELRARFGAKNLLVLCPKTLCQKWKDELYNRFGVEAAVVNAAEFLELIEAGRPERKGIAVIVSLQALRPPKAWEPDTEEPVFENEGQKVRARIANLLASAATEKPIFDLLVVDEAHHMRNPETKLYQLGRLANDSSAYRVFLSATPIHLRNRDLHSLLKLIDPQTFEFDSTLDDLISANRPLILARDALNSSATPRKQIIQYLEEARTHNLLQDSRILDIVRKSIEQGEWTAGKRAEIAAQLEQANLLSNTVTRTRRRDVQEFRVIREVLCPEILMNARERAFYDAVTSEVRQYAIDRDVSDGFLLSPPQRMLSSSLAATAIYWLSRLPAEDPFQEEGDDDLLGRPTTALEQPLVAILSDLTRSMGIAADLEAEDSKFSALQTSIESHTQAPDGRKLIVFSSFRSTIDYLHRRLESAGIASIRLHGGISDERSAILRRFKDDEEIRVLLTSEVGSEGVDLQFAWFMVNYDLPWNPMRLEQRIGRIDRLGQKRDKVVVHNLLYKDTIDERVYQRLFMRLEIGKQALGELEAVLGERMRSLEAALLNPALTPEQQNERIEQTASALENLRVHEQELEREADALIRHGDFILAQIEQRRRSSKWLTGEDILLFVKDTLDKAYPATIIEAYPPGGDTFRIVLDGTARRELGIYIQAHGGTTRLERADNSSLYRFTASVVDRPTHNSEPISQLHPLVRFCARLVAQDGMAAGAQVSAARCGCPHGLPLAPGAYLVGLRRWTLSTAQAPHRSYHLAYAGIPLDGGAALPADVAEELFLHAVMVDRQWIDASVTINLEAAAAQMEDRLESIFSNASDLYFEQAVARIDDRANIRKAALERHRNLKREQSRLRKERLQWDVTLADISGDAARASRLRNLIKAEETKLRAVENLVLSRLEANENQRSAEREQVDLAYLLVLVEQ